MGAIIPPPFTADQLRAQRIIGRAQISQHQFPNTTPLSITTSLSNSNPSASAVITDFGVQNTDPWILGGDSRLTLVNGFNMTNNFGQYVPSYPP